MKIFLPDPDNEVAVGSHYAVSFATPETDWTNVEISSADAISLMSRIESYMETRASEQFFASSEYGVEMQVNFTSSDLVYQINDGEDVSVNLADPVESIESIENSDVGVSDFGSIQNLMADMLGAGDQDSSDQSITLKSEDTLFDLVITGTNDSQDAGAVLENIARVMFDETIDLTLVEVSTDIV